MDVRVWLESLGQGEYAQAFIDNHIDATTLPRLTAEDLKEIGVQSVGHRRKLLDAIAGLVEGGPELVPPPGAQADPALKGEQRQVTVLFADLAGFTRLSDELGAEETHALLNRYFEAVDGIVAGYGGHVDKHMGDNVMAVFGAPLAHSDDPERAVRAALDIHKAMADLSDDFGRSLEAHIGIASGQVVASGTGSETHQEYTVTGNSVNLASRLQDKASAGETLISQAVYGAVSGLVDCTPMGEMEVKGFEHPVRVWRLAELRSETSAGEHVPLVGRRSERRQFTGIVEECLETGTGQAILVRGEAGIGKTRLAEEFASLAGRKGFATHKELVLDFGVGKGQDAIRSMVRSLLGLASVGSKAERTAVADQAVEEGWLEPDERVFLNDLLDLPQSTELRALYDAMDNATRNSGKQAVVAKLIESMSAKRAILVTVEDIHWADPLTLGHLASIASAVANHPVILVMTSRAVGDPLDQAWRASLRGSPLVTIDLRPLRETEAMELASGLVEASTTFVQNCIERAEGNPFFLEQLLRNVEEGALTDVPGSIQSLVLARMDRLEPRDKQAIQAAAVIGQRFTLDALRHLLEDATYDCKVLAEHYLVRPEGAGYLFAHALIQEGVYSSLLQIQKREIHRGAAAWFAGKDPVLYAEHLDRADDPAAPRAYLEAAEVQASEFRYERARQMVERGLELATEQAEKYDLTCFRGDILRDLGLITDSIDAFANALEFAHDDVKRCRAWIGMAAGLRVVDRYDEAFEALDLAESAATNHGLTGELAQIHYHRGNLYFPLGDIDRCLEQHELALRYARHAGSAEGEARALGGLGDAYYMRGHMITAHDHFHRCIELCRANGFGRIELPNLPMRGLTRWYQHDLTTALDDCRTAAEAAAKVGRQRAEMVARTSIGNVLLEMADLAGAKEQSELALALARRLGARRFEATALHKLSLILAAEGSRSEATKLLQKALSISRETGNTFIGPVILGALAVVTGDPAVRRQALDEGVDILRKGCVSHNYLLFYRYAMEAALDSGDWDGVERYAAALEDYTRPEPLPWSNFLIARGRALAAYGRGVRDEVTMQELQCLRDEAERVGLKAALPPLEKVLSTAV
ncbi:MAG: tetratricopeptide repeat protein [Gammaproteobacteria bacterium]|nr:tetratricopeptide repeat protein [Gammaproteobacteria bacterium]